MSFASALNKCCEAAGCTNKELAELCGISPSTLSRYRNGNRAPESDAAVVARLARGIAELSRGPHSREHLTESDVRAALEAGMNEARMAGMSFNMRFDALMHLTGVRNVKMAEATQVDPSYISRIRKGVREPANMAEFADVAARLFAQACLDNGLVDDASKLIGDVTYEEPSFGAGYDDNSNLAEAIGTWLLGGNIVEADIAEMEKLFAWLDATDLGEWLARAGNPHERPGAPDEPAHVARFYYGVDGMKSAELDFLAMAAETHARELSLSSDMPLLQMDLDRGFIEKYRRAIAQLLEAGCHVNIVHGVERPLGETIQSLRLWIPFYLTGLVSPYYLKGIHNRLFCHVNYVCDTCALSSEAMIGHQEDGRYFFTSRPADVLYYQKKMGFILERASQLLEMYRDSVPEQRAAFERAEAARQAGNSGRPVGVGRYKRLSVVSYAADGVVVSLRCGTDTVRFVIRQPKISYAVSRMK